MQIEETQLFHHPPMAMFKKRAPTASTTTLSSSSSANNATTTTTITEQLNTALLDRDHLDSGLGSSNGMGAPLQQDQEEVKLHQHSAMGSRLARLKRWTSSYDPFSSAGPQWHAITSKLLQRNEEIVFSETRSKRKSCCLPHLMVFLILSLVLVPSEVFLLLFSDSPFHHRLAFHLFILWLMVSLISIIFIYPPLLASVCYILTTDRAIVLYDVLGNILALGCEYGQMNMIEMKASIRDGTGYVHFRRDPFPSRGFRPFSSKTLFHSDWGFHHVARPEIVESIIFDVGGNLEGKNIDFGCQAFHTPQHLITITRTQEVLSFIQLYSVFPLLVVWAFVLHPLFAIIQFIIFLLMALHGLQQFNLLAHKDFNPGYLLSYILLAGLGVFVSLLDILDATAGLPYFSENEESTSLVDNKMLRILLNCGNIFFMVVCLVIATVNLRRLFQHMRMLYLFTIKN